MVFKFFLDFIYPPKCGLCGAVGTTSICEECLAEFAPMPTPLEGKKGELDWRFSLFQFDGRAAQAVKRLKYARITSLSIPMAKMLAEALEKCPEVDVIVPVPIHSSRRAQRGFNQSDLLCNAMPRDLVKPALAVRTRKTRPQVELTAAERRANLEGAFVANDSVKGQSVLLVDDVITTGGTAQACAEALKASGASSVGVLTFCGERTTLVQELPIRVIEPDREHAT